jgi:thiamine pyrophosphokinase
MSAMLEFAETNIVLLGRTSMAVLIPPETTVIRPDLGAEGPSCGLVPLIGPARVTTSGLKWNLDGDEITFGRFISTSNELLPKEVSSGEVVFTTDRALVWTTDISKLRQDQAGE